jgi:hypothetical protein
MAQQLTSRTPFMLSVAPFAHGGLMSVWPMADWRDSRLIRQAAELQASQTALDAFDPADDDEFGSKMDAALTEFWRIAGEVEEARAHSMNGLQAKARVLRLVFECTRGDDDRYYAGHMLGLIRDLNAET